MEVSDGLDMAPPFQKDKLREAVCGFNQEEEGEQHEEQECSKEVFRTPTIEDLLPNEILGFIFLHFPCTKDLLSASMVSKQWFAMANDFSKRRCKVFFLKKKLSSQFLL